MDLATRKYNFIQELINLDKESILETLERVLKEEKEEHQEIPKEIEQELDNRLESYRQNPNDLLNWNEIKETW